MSPSDLQNGTIYHSPSEADINHQTPQASCASKECYSSSPLQANIRLFNPTWPVPSYNLCYFGTMQPLENPVIKQPSSPLVFSRLG